MKLYTTSDGQTVGLGINGPSVQVGSFVQDDTLLDSALDNVRTRKDPTDGHNYRLEYRELDIAAFGIKPRNTAAQNDAARAVMLAAGISHEVLLLDAGHYQFGSGLYGLGQHVSLKGLGNGVTSISYPSNCVGFHLTRNKQVNYGSFYAEGLTIFARGQATDDGILLPGEVEPNFYGDPNLRMLFYANRKKSHGLHLEVPFVLKDVGVYSFSGHQLKAEGNIDGYGTDCSNSYTDPRCEFSAGNRYRPDGSYAPGYGGCGIYVTGNDANKIILDHPNVTNNPQAGILDASGLGIDVRQPHGSENGWGHFHSTNPSSASSYANPYLEGGSPPSTVPNNCHVMGGMRGSPMYGGLNFDGSYLQGTLSFGTGSLNRDGSLRFAGFGNNGGFGLLDVSTAANPLAHWALRVPSSDNNVNPMDWIAAGGKVYGRNSPYGPRSTDKLTFAASEPVFDCLTQYASASFPTFVDVTASLRPGDMIRNSRQGLNQPGGWDVRGGGYANPPVYSEGLTATATKTDAGGIYNLTYALSGPTMWLWPGTFVTIGGKTSAIAPFSPDQTRFAHVGDEVYYNATAFPTGVPVRLGDGSIVPGTTDLRVIQLDAQNTLLLANQALPTLALNTPLRLLYDNGTTFRTIYFSGFLDDVTRLNFYEAMPLGTNLPITYAKAQLVPTTSGTGTTAQQPSLSGRPDHIGWGYWNTTTNTLQHWNGTAYA